MMMPTEVPITSDSQASIDAANPEVATASQPQAISDEDYLYRVVHKNKFSAYGLDTKPVIELIAFEPSCSKNSKIRDDDGISCYLASSYRDANHFFTSFFLAFFDDDTVREQRKKANGVVRVKMSVICALGVDAIHSPDQKLVGHVVIPQLNCSELKANKNHVKNVYHQIAAHVNEHCDELILIVPSEQ